MNIRLDGLERSGNNYLAICIGVTLGVEIDVRFEHLLSTLEQRDKGDLFVIPVRDVLPTIVSAKLYRDYQWQNGIPMQDEIFNRVHKRTGNPQELIERFTEYTDYLVNNNDFLIAPFHEFINDHNKIIDLIVKLYPQFSIQHRFTKEEMLQICDDRYKYRNPHLNEQSDPYLGNFPRNEAKEKKDIEKMFLSEYRKEIEHIQSNIDKLYQRYYSLI